jgi:hypothetical protein
MGALAGQFFPYPAAAMPVTDSICRALILQRALAGGIEY